MRIKKNTEESDRKIRSILAFLFGIVFLFSTAAIGKTLLEYRIFDVAHETLAAEVITAKKEVFSDAEAEKRKANLVPFTVDFEALQKINEDIAGWIYCEGTNISYPVLQGTDNDFYLEHIYDKTAGQAGSIFVEAHNAPDFTDSNTIIYGHHRKDGSMFASLEKWSEQEYYEEHPVFWLLTPEQNYRMILFSGYTTMADSDAYTIYPNACQAFEEYLYQASQKSDFHAEAEYDAKKRFVVLSTCSYAFENARYVLHGMLEPYKMD